MSFEWPKNPYPEMNINLTLSASHTSWNQSQEAAKLAIEAYLGCSMEVAKEAMAEAETYFKSGHEMGLKHGREQAEKELGCSIEEAKQGLKEYMALLMAEVRVDNGFSKWVGEKGG